MENLNVREQMSKETMRYMLVQRGREGRKDFAIAVFWLQYDAEKMRQEIETDKKNGHYYIYDRVKRRKIDVDIRKYMTNHSSEN